MNTAIPVSSSLDRMSRLYANRLPKCKSLKPDCGGDGRDTMAKEPNANSKIGILIRMLNDGTVDEARELVEKNRAELVGWLKSGGYTAGESAKRLATYAKKRCSTVPEEAELILVLFKEAGLRERIEYVSKSPYPEIAELAERYL
ncbi:MAG: hypothetical protein M1530_00200 [Candidatus Marsarchaeota archaeon]|nr:hypothetical protein [Candidatus Marsarchaeota archaeon]